MPYDITLKQLPAQSFVGIRRRVKADAIGPALAEILPTVLGYLGRCSIAPASPPAMLYYEHDEAAGEFDIQGGFFVPQPVAGEDSIQTVEISSGGAAATMHIGPYERLGDAHGALHRWIDQHGRKLRPPWWDIYWSDPGEVPDPNDYRTEVVWPLR